MSGQDNTHMQVMPPPTLSNTQTSTPEAAPQTAAEAVELAMGINASIQSASVNGPLPQNTDQNSESDNTNGWGNYAENASNNGWGPAVGTSNSGASNNGWMDEPAREDYNGWGVPDSGPVGNQNKHAQTSDNVPTVVPSNNGISMLVPSASAPSAPPIPEDVLDEGPIHYPSVDYSPVDLSVPAIEAGASVGNDVKDGGSSSSCVICWEAPIEGACIPCGHMAGCMSCLNEIKAKKGLCPMCRATINQVVRLYAV